MKKISLVVLLIEILLMAACLQDSESDRIAVRYTVLVRDGNTGAALQGASVEFTGENFSAITLSTNENGRITFPAVESYVNQVIVSMEGYVPTDTVDVVTVSDSSLNVVLRTLNLALLPKNSSTPDSSQIYSYTVTVLKASDMEPIEGANVSVRSGTLGEFSAKTGATGRAFLDSLPSRQNLFSIMASGYVPIDTIHLAPDTSQNSEVLCALRVVLLNAVSE